MRLPVKEEVPHVGNSEVLHLAKDGAELRFCSARGLAAVGSYDSLVHQSGKTKKEKETE